MPRIISDELFDSLMQCVKDQRLLGVMGLLERCQREAEKALVSDEYLNGDEGKIVITEYITQRRLNDGPETDNN